MNLSALGEPREPVWEVTLNLGKCFSQSLLHGVREIWRIIAYCLVSGLLHLHLGGPTLLHSLTGSPQRFFTSQDVCIPPRCIPFSLSSPPPPAALLHPILSLDLGLV